MIIDSPAVIRNNTEKFHVPFTPFPPVVTSCITIVQYHYQGIDRPPILFRLHHCYMHSFVCVCVFSSSQFYHMCMFIESCPQSRYRTILSLQRSFPLPFYNYNISLPCLFPSPIAPLNLQTPLILFCLSIALSFQECYRNEIIQYVPFLKKIIYLAESGLSCGMWDLSLRCSGSLLWPTGFSLVVARGLSSCSTRAI